jgi:hypothetical protein
MRRQARQHMQYERSRPGEQSAMVNDSLHQDVVAPDARDRVAAYKASMATRPTPVSKLQHDFVVNLAERMSEDKYASEEVDQREFPVLFASFSPVAGPVRPYYCVMPWIVHMHFYGSNDISIGAFLVNYCFNENYRCPYKVWFSQNGIVPNCLSEWNVSQNGMSLRMELSQIEFLARLDVCSLAQFGTIGLKTLIIS